MFIHLFIPYFTMLLHHIAPWYCTMLQQNRIIRVLKQDHSCYNKTGSITSTSNHIVQTRMIQNHLEQPRVIYNNIELYRTNQNQLEQCRTEFQYMFQQKKQVPGFLGTKTIKTKGTYIRHLGAQIFSHPASFVIDSMQNQHTPSSRINLEHPLSNS